VSLAFADGHGDVMRRLEALRPRELQVDGRTAEMVIDGEEAALLEKLADVSRDIPILSFEVRGPTLEEIFVSLVREGR
jgi:hypothetical protein